MGCLGPPCTKRGVRATTGKGHHANTLGRAWAGAWEQGPPRRVRQAGRVRLAEVLRPLHHVPGFSLQHVVVLLVPVPGRQQLLSVSLRKGQGARGKG